MRAAVSDKKNTDSDITTSIFISVFHDLRPIFLFLFVSVYTDMRHGCYCTILKCYTYSARIGQNILLGRS